jgi:uncharacterized protein (TIGR02996 family)
MTEGDDLFRAIVENPDDDNVRLVFADWLTENGQPERGDFIRVQCELERLSADDPRKPGLAARERELLAGREEEWGGSVGRLGQATFRRGFAVRTVLVLEHTWNPRGGLAEPIDDAGVAALAACPSALWLTSLLLGCNSLGDATAEAIATSRYLTRLTVLDLGGEPEYYSSWRRKQHLTATGVRLLADSPNVARLTHLVLSCHGLRDDAAEALAAAPALARLESLDLRTNNIGADGVQALIDSPHLTSLKRLGLINNPGGVVESYYYDWDGSYASADVDTGALAALVARFGRKIEIF